MSRGFRLYSKLAKKYIDYLTIGFSKTGELRSYSTENGSGPAFEDFYIVEQDTGLKDKNGEEIYEGDIIRYGDQFYEVKFDEMKDSDCSYYYLGWSMGDLSLCEHNTMSVVIGNINENPELLGVENE